MSNSPTRLREMLQISADSSVEEAASALTALLTAAVHDEHPPHSLQQIYGFLQHQPECYIDGLTVVPLLLQCTGKPFAAEILHLAGSQCSAKEVIISTQEAVEKISIDLQSEDEDEEDAPGSHTTSLIAAVRLYTLAIPRLLFRKKTASATIAPLFDDIKLILQHIGNNCKTDEGRTLLTDLSALIQQTLSWCRTQPTNTPEERMQYHTVLHGLIDTAVLSLSRSIDASVCARAFQTRFPRLGSLEQLNPGWESGEAAIGQLLRARNALEPPHKGVSDVDIIVRAYTDDTTSPIDSSILASLMPVIIACLQTNFYLEEALTVLLMALTNPNVGEISEETISMPLASLLPAVASHQPDAQLRHYAYRILSLLLQRSCSLTRMSILRELLSDESLPIRMRAATIALVKEALLEGLAAGDNVFASPRFLQAFGPVLFRIPDGFDLINDEKMEGEAVRIAEVLALYYICLIRDTKNKTGIRDRDNIKNVEQALLTPLRKLFEQTYEDTALIFGAPLMTALERVDEAI